MHPWAWHAHPVAWLLIAGLAAAYGWGLRRTGTTPTRRQATSYVTGLIALAVALTWPLADLAARWSVAAHFGSHLLLALIVPALLLLGIPGPVAVAATAPVGVDRALHGLTNPFVATVLFNSAVVGAHIPPVMNATVRSEPIHALVHLWLFVAGVVMWLTALRVLPGRRRMGSGGRIGFLALQSLVPNIPAAILLFAGNQLYPAYGERPRALRMSPLLDQQMGGILVKFLAVSILGGTAAVIFFRWIGSGRGSDEEPLTWIDVERELRRRKPPAA